MGVIYKITNTVNKKIYIGKTIAGAGRRFSQHKDYAKHKKLDTYLYRAMRKYGCENFTIEVIDSALLDEELCGKEMEWIAKLNSTDRTVGYNGTFGGQSGLMTPAVREKMKGRPCSPETRRKISEAQIGKKLPAEQIRRMSLARKGKPVSPERAAAMKANPPGLGTKRTPEQRKRMSEGILASWTPELRAKVSAIQLASRAKSPRPGHKPTPENVKKLGEATRRRWAQMTPEQRKEAAKPSLEKARVALRDPEVIKKRNAAIKAAWTEEKRAAWAIKMRPQLIEQNDRLVEAARARRAA